MLAHIVVDHNWNINEVSDTFLRRIGKFKTGTNLVHTAMKLSQDKNWKNNLELCINKTTSNSSTFVLLIPTIIKIRGNIAHAVEYWVVQTIKLSNVIIITFNDDGVENAVDNMISQIPSLIETKHLTINYYRSTYRNRVVKNVELNPYVYARLMPKLAKINFKQGVDCLEDKIYLNFFNSSSDRVRRYINKELELFLDGQCITDICSGLPGNCIPYIQLPNPLIIC